jgi:hypothetical protein
MTFTSVILNFEQEFPTTSESFQSGKGVINLPRAPEKSKNFQHLKSTKKKMKKISTFQKVVLCLAFILVTSGAKAQNVSQLNFNTVPTLISGVLNLVNAKYRFYSVKNNVDALVTIVSSSNNAKIDIFDDNDVTKPEAFSPKISVPANKNGYVEFKIEFVRPITNAAVPMDSIFATAIDIDGNNQVKEFDVIDMGANSLASYAATNPEISLTKSGTAWTGTNIAGIEYDGIDSSAKKVMFTVKNKNVNYFIYRAGVNNSSSSSVSRQKSIYFKDFAYPNQVTLPVKYSSFDASVADRKVTLKWVTVMESNNHHFEVERSFNATSFATIGLVLDAEQVLGNDRTYRFKDASAELQGKSVAYYRLRQVDVDGKVTYSSTLAVRLQSAATDIAVQASPNPFVEQVTLRFNAEANATAQVRIVNTNGQTLLSKQSVIAKGYNNLMVDGLGKLPKGMYIAQLLIDGKIAGSQPVVK